MHEFVTSLFGRTTDLRRYARWEYGSQEAAGWILAEARRSPRRTI